MIKLPSEILIDYETGVMTITTDTDTVPYTEPYYVKLFNFFDSDSNIDYLELPKGYIGIKYDRTLYKLNFDINSNGELVVIGEDANNYFLSKEGDENHGVTTEGGILYYGYLSGGIGEMIIENTFIII